MTTFPSEIDTDVSLPPVIDNVSEMSGDIWNGLRDAILAIETALGADPQGSQNSLVDRLDQVLNADGTFKSSALNASGLISLPVDNSHIGGSAAIEESKLNLDFGTQELQNQITSNDVDITNLQQGLASLLSRYSLHIVGSYDRHDSDHVDHVLADGYLSGAGATVAAALDFLSGKIDAHKVATGTVEHFASAIYFDPSQTVPGQPDIIISANVQAALEEVEFAIVDSVRAHNDYAHSDGVLADGYSIYGGLAGVNDAALRLTRYQPPSGTDILKIGLCNAATIKGRGFDPIGITSSINALRVEYSYNGLTTNFSASGLDTSAYPVGNSRITLLGVVDALNAAAASGNDPLSFFASDDGEIVIQANVAVPGFTIKVLTSPVTSAYAVLGFGDISDISVGPSSNHHFTVNGTIYSELATISEGSGNQSSLSNVVDLGVTVDSGGLNLSANSLLHIFSHTTAGSIGTYKVTGLSGSTSVILSSNLAAGDFEYIIYRDTLDTNAITSDRRVIDAFIDSERMPVISERATTVFGGLEGVRIVGVSRELSEFTGSYTLATSGSQREFYFTDDGYGVGTSALFDPGYIGYLRAWFPDNVNYADILVFSVSPTNGTDTITVVDGYFDDSSLYLGSAHHNGLTDIEFPINSRNIGSVSSSQLSSDFYRFTYNQDINNFHVSGIVRGFDVISTTSSTINIRGGSAYINGKRLDVETTTLTLPVAALADGTYNIVIDEFGTINYFLEDDSASSTSYSVADILRHDLLILVCQFVVATNAITGTTDGRFFINDIESKLQLTVDDRDLGAGSFRSLDAAVLYSQNAPNDVKPEISVLSDLTVSGNLSIGAGDRIVCFGDLTVSGNLSVSSGGELVVYGAVDIGGTSSISAASSVEFLGGGTLTGATSIAASCSLIVGGTLTCTTIACSGASITLRGSESDGVQPVVLFAGTSDGLTGTASLVTISNLTFTMTISTYDIADIVLSDFHIYNCYFQQSTALSNAQLAVLTRCGLNVEGVAGRISNCTFYNLGAGIRIKTGSSEIFVSGCQFDRIGTAIEGAGTCDNVIVSGSLITNLHIDGIIVRDNWAIFDNIFDGQLNSYPTSSPTIISSVSAAINVIVSKNLFLDYDAYEVIDLTGDSDYAIISSNLLSSCSTNRSYLIAVNDNSTIYGNIMSACNGQLISAGINTSLSANSIEEIGSTGASNIISISGGSVVGNHITTDSFQALLFNGCTVSGNYISTGNISTTGAASQYSGNYINCTRTGTVYGVQLTHTSGYGSFVGNLLISAAASTSSSAAFRADAQVLVASNFIISSASANRCVEISAAYCLVTGNIISSGGTYGIYVNENNISVQNNIVYGAVSGLDIHVTTGRESVIITGNLLAGTGGTRVGHADASPTSVYIGLNKGGQERRAYSVFSGYRSGTWTYSTSGFQSNTTNDFITIGLDNLPVGASLDSVNIYVTNAGSSGDGTAQIFTRSTSSPIHSSISSETSMANGFQGLSVSVSSTTYIRSGYEYFVKINVKDTAAITLSQVVANITI